MHVHARLMAQYARDTMISEAPWEFWQFSLSQGETWGSCDDHPVWAEDTKYRRVINIGGYKVPEPVRDPAELEGGRYYLADITARVLGYSWLGDSIAREWLSKGLIHRTKEDAEAHVRALLSFTEELV